MTYYYGANSLYVDDESGTRVGPIAIGPAGTSSNANCSVQSGVTGTYVSANGGDLTLGLSVTFSINIFGGDKSVYMFAQNKQGVNSGRVQKGQWTVPGGNSPACQVPIEN